MTWLSKSFHNAPVTNSTAVTTVEDTVGNKADIAVTVPGGTTSVIAYLKGLFALSPLPISKALTLDASEAEKVFNAFTVTGAVEITRLYGVLTGATTLTNATAAGFRIVDNATHTHLDAGDGVLSGLAVGTVIANINGAAATTPTVLSNATGATANPSFTPFFVVKKTGQTTYISFAYTTTDAPSAATMTVYAEYRALSSDGALTAV
jgi:hypothetical protein